MMKELRDSGVKEEFAHVTAVAGRALARQGRKDRGKRYDNVPNVEMCELEEEMDKDSSVVLKPGWATR